MVKMLDLQSWGRWFNSRLGRHQVVNTWMGDCLRTGELSLYITNTKVNSPFHSSTLRDRYIEYQLGFWVMMGCIHLCWSHMAGDTPCVWGGFLMKRYTI